MSATAVALDQIVVTGTAGNQEVKAQSAVVATIDAADLMAKASILNVNELLYARTPGVSLTVASGASGANTRIDIRGQASISLSNNPLVFVDGVRITSGARGTVGNGVGGQTLNALNDINPEDIESIEIVKGPAAATLYGSDASAGVIQVLTKKGRTGVRRFSQRLTTEYDNIDPNFTPDDNYGICNTAALIAATSRNILCTGKTLGTVVSDNVLVRNGVFRDGWSGILQYSAQGGGDNFGYYVSASSNNESGTQPGNFLNHRTARANFNWTASTKMSLDASIGLTRADDKLAKGDQDSFSLHAERRMGSARDERHGRPERNARRRMAEQQRLHRVGQRDQHRGRDDSRHAVRDRSLFASLVVHEPRHDGRRLHARVGQPDVSAQLVRLVQRDAEYRSGHCGRGEHDAVYGGLPGEYQSTRWTQRLDLVRSVVRHAMDQRRLDAALRNRNRIDDEHLEPRFVGDRPRPRARDISNPNRSAIWGRSKSASTTGCISSSARASTELGVWRIRTHVRPSEVRRDLHGDGRAGDSATSAPFISTFRVARRGGRLAARREAPTRYRPTRSRRTSPTLRSFSPACHRAARAMRTSSRSAAWSSRADSTPGSSTTDSASSSPISTKPRKTCSLVFQSRRRLASRLSRS